MIHSNSTSFDEVKSFCQKFRKFDLDTPLIVVPSTYHNVTEDELESVGINIVIYANHLLRAAYPAMEKTAKQILIDKSAKNTDQFCMPIKDIINLIPEGD